MRYFMGCVIGILSVFSAFAALPSKVDIYTEHFPPYQTKQQNGTIAGYATDIVRLIMWEAQLNYQIFMLPWSRAQRFAEQSRYALLYSLARTEAREQSYIWLTPLCEMHIAFFIRPELDLEEQDWHLNKIKRHTVAVAANQPSEQFLLERGFEPDDNLLSVSSLSQAGELMQRQRIDFIFGAQRFVEQLASSMGVSHSWRKVLVAPTLSKTLYLTAHPSAPEDYVKHLRQAAQRVLPQQENLLDCQ